MSSLKVSEALKEHRNGLLQSAISSDDPGYRSPLKDALEPDYLQQTADDFAQVAGNSLKGQVSAAAENALMADVRRAKQLTHETRVERMRRIYRSRLCEAAPTGILDSRVNNTGARAGSDVPSGGAG